MWFFMHYVAFDMSTMFVLPSICSPVLVRIYQRLDRNVAVLDMLDPTKDHLDVLRRDNVPDIDAVARDHFDIPLFEQAGEVSCFYCRL